MHVVYTHPVCKCLSACGVTFRHVQRRLCIYSIHIYIVLYSITLSCFLLSSFLVFLLYSFLLSFYSSIWHVSFLSHLISTCLSVRLSVCPSVYLPIYLLMEKSNSFTISATKIESIQNNLGCYHCNNLESFCSYERLAFLLAGCYIKHNQST